MYCILIDREYLQSSCRFGPYKSNVGLTIKYLIYYHVHELSLLSVTSAQGLKYKSFPG